MEIVDPSKAFFIVIEGMDGTGKTEVSLALYKKLEKYHRNRVYLTKEPYDEREDEIDGSYNLIQLMRDGKTVLLHRTQAMIFAVNRLVHCAEMIMPSLGHNANSKRTSIVICDRYIMSSLAYQSGDSLSMEEIYEMNQDAIRPNMTFVLYRAHEDIVRTKSERNLEMRINGLSQIDHLDHIHYDDMINRYMMALAFMVSKGEEVFTISPNKNTTVDNAVEHILSYLHKFGPEWLLPKETK